MVHVQPIDLALLASVLAFCGYDQHYQKWHAPRWEPFKLILGNLLDVGHYDVFGWLTIPCEGYNCEDASSERRE
jgi:hypothetical protein